MHQDYVRAEAAPNSEAQALLEVLDSSTEQQQLFSRCIKHQLQHQLLYIDDLSAFKHMMLKYY